MVRHTLLLVVALFVMSSCASTPDDAASGGARYDTVVEGEMFLIDPMLPNSVVMALEEPLEEFPHAVVSFRVLRTLVGEMPVTVTGGPSPYEQAKDAARNKDILKILTADFDNPDEEIPVEWLTVAVHDTEKAFGVKSEDWLEEHEDRYKIYLKKRSERPGTFVFVKAVKK